MAMSFSIRVIDGTGRPRVGEKVSVSYGRLYGLLHGREVTRTGTDGQAFFAPEGDFCRAKIYIKNQLLGEHPIFEGATLYLTV